MFWGKDGAAVVERQDRDVIGADFAGDFDDVFFVHADERTEYGHTDDAVGDGKPLYCLAGYLSDRLSRNQCLTAVFARDFFGDSHHEAAHYYRRHIGRTQVAYIFLYFRERYGYQRDSASIL